MKIGFLGLGAMGHAMARRLLNAGHGITVYNRTASKADDLVADGARLARTPADAAGMLKSCSRCSSTMLRRRPRRSVMTVSRRPWGRAQSMSAAPRYRSIRPDVFAMDMPNGAKPT